MKAGTTPPILGSNGRPLPNSIADVQYIKLSGVEQWVMIRGSNVTDNPILILLHGGPGISETAYWRFYNSSALEKSFTVVYWDQLGSGKSYNPTITKDKMTIETFVTSLDELVDTVCHRCSKNKVTIFGHSWGSFLGPIYAARFPNKVAAYVGSGQIGDWAESEKATYAYVLNEAGKRGDYRLVRDLQKIGPPPHNCDGLFKQRESLAKLDGDLSLHALLKLIRIFISVPESSILDLFHFWKILRFSITAMWKDLTQLNLINLTPELKMPTFFFLGRQDHCVLPEISVAFIEQLICPSKEVVWFENSKHLPFADEPEKFNALMEELVRPASVLN
jgi:pimeloyl-ACP methyl ester carboxylesterase